MPLDYRLLAIFLVGLLGGCSSVGKSTEPLNFTTSAGPNAPGGDGPGYALSTEEQTLDCKKLIGRMQVRIMQMRGYETREKTTIASRALHTAGKSIIGGTNQGLETDAQYAKDKAMLNAYNGLLVSKNCKSFNVEEALNGAAQPVPTIEAPSKAKAADEKAMATTPKAPKL